MKLEPRIERLEARVPDISNRVTEIILVGVDRHGNTVGPTASAYFEGGQWTQFEENTLR